MLNQNDFPKNWKISPIKNFVFFQEGPGVRKFQYTDSGVKLLNGGNINDGKLDLSTTERYISNEEASGKYKHFLVDEGDLLIACSGVVVEKFDGKIAYAMKEHLPLCMNTSTMRFKSLNKAILNIDFFRRFLATSHFKSQLQKLITGSAQLNFGPSHIEQMYLPLPPLEEQKRIAAILDKADAIRRKRQQAIKLADEFLRAVFLDMFGDPVENTKGWEVRPLGKNIIHANNGLSRRRKVPDNFGEIVLRLQDVHYEGIHFDKELNRIQLDASEKKRFLVNKGDILFIRVNGNPDYVGRSSVFEGHKEDVYHNDHLIRLKVSEAYDPVFLSYCFNYEGGRKIISKQIKTSAGQHTISQSGIEMLEFYMPPIILQKKFVHIRNSIIDIPFEGDLPNDLFASLSQKAFSAQL